MAFGVEAYCRIWGVLRILTRFITRHRRGSMLNPVSPGPSGEAGRTPRPRSSARRTLSRTVERVVAQQDHAWYAPALLSADGRSELVAVRARRESMRFRDRTWPDGRHESWFDSAEASFSTVPTGFDQPLATAPGWHRPLPGWEYTGVASACVQGSTHIWFGCRPPGGRWTIAVVRQADDGGWSDPVTALEASSPEDRDILLPSVAWWHGQLHMWFVARGEQGRRIHLARSADGRIWERLGVVLDQGSEWEADGYAADCPSVVPVDNRLLMAYGAGTSRAIAAAVSVDGESWTRLGPLVHRGGEESFSANYAFYPALELRSGSMRCWFAAEDAQGVWSLARTEEFDPVALLERPPARRLGAETGQRLMAAVPKLRPEHLAVTDDAHGSAPGLTCTELGITQVRPSSTAVLRLHPTESSGVVVKLGRSRTAVQDEHDLINTLSGQFRVPPAALAHVGQRTWLVMDDLGDQTLAEVSHVLSPSQFTEQLNIYTESVRRTMADSVVPAEDGMVDWPRQSPPMLHDWLDKVLSNLGATEARCFDIDGRSLPSNLSEISQAWASAAARRTTWVALGNGDPHLRNVVVGPDGPRLIDFEFAGSIDVDFTVSKIIASALKHTPYLAAATASIERNVWHVRSGLIDPPPFFELGWWQRRFDGLPIDWERTTAFTAADMVFRVRSEPTGEGAVLTGIVAALWAQTR